MQRDEIIAVLTETLEAADHVRAAWLGGSDATGRTDEHSDVDIVVVAEDDRVEDVFAMLEAALAARSPIERRYRLPTPTWHGHEQAFYRLADAGPHRLVDLVVMRHSAEDRFLERERHGTPVVLIDRDGIVAPAPFDRVAHQARLEARLDEIRHRVPMFLPMTLKCIERGHPTEAMQMFRALTLTPLVELLRIRHCPDQFDFGFRYLDRDLPPELARAVDRLSYAADMDALRAHVAEAERLFERYADGAPSLATPSR